MIYHGRVVLRKIRVSNLENAKALINQTVVLLLAHIVIISLQFYLNCFLLQDLIATWESTFGKSADTMTKSRSGTFSFTRQKNHTGAVNHNLELLQEEVDITVIALATIVSFGFSMCLVGLVCMSILRAFLVYRDKIVYSSKVYLPEGAVEMNKVNEIGEFEPNSDEEETDTFVV